MEVLAIGETMLLFDPVTNGPLRYVDRFSKRIGGAESNVAIGLTRLGHDVGWVSKLGDDEMGHYIRSFIRGEGIDTSRVAMARDFSTGIYIKEKLLENQSNVYYYRKGSAASQMTVRDMDWDYIKQAKVIHLTGITPLLSENCWELVQEIFAFAKNHNITLSFDPNIRKKIWNDPVTAKNRLLKLSEQCDWLVAGRDEIELLLETENTDSNIEYFLDHDVSYVILKDGSNGTYYADKNHQGFLPSVKVSKVVDPVGAGDGFAAGFLSSILEGESLENAVRTGAVVGAMVVSTNGDIEGLPSKQLMERFLHGKSDVIR